MIEKLKEHDIVDPKTGKVIGKIGCDLRELMDKLNELVDDVNDLVYECDKDSDWYDGQTRAENSQDEYDGQRKWMGFICRFWYDNPNDTLLDYLDKIQMGKNGVEYYAKESGNWFPNCEPVLPTDNAIYKGDKNV